MNRKSNSQLAAARKHVTLHSMERFVERALGSDPKLLNTAERKDKVREEIYLQVKMYLGMSGKFKVPMKDYEGCKAVIENGTILTIIKEGV